VEVADRQVAALLGHIGTGGIYRVQPSRPIVVRDRSVHSFWAVQRQASCYVPFKVESRALQGRVCYCIRADRLRSI